MGQSLTGNIDFLLTLDTTNGQHTFNATLKNIEGEFRIYLHPDKTISFNELVKQSRFWNDEIPYFGFGKSLIVENTQINGTEIELDLSKAKLITSQTIVSSKGNAFYFIIDTYQYRYADTMNQDKTLFYLSETSSELVRDLQLIEYDIEGKVNKVKTVEGYISDIKFNFKPNLEIKPCTGIIEYFNYIPTQKIDYNNIVLDLLSFYYGVPVEVIKLIQPDDGKIRVTYRQPTYKIRKNSYHNMDLAYLDFALERYTFDNFIKSIKTGFSQIQDLHVILNDYVRALYLDEMSKFTILYSIIEIKAKSETKFSDKKNMVNQFEILYEQFSSKISLTEDESKEQIYSGQDSKPKNSLRAKWDKLKESLVYRPFPSNYIDYYIGNIGIDWAILNQDLLNFKIKDIKKLRNEITHQRKCDYNIEYPLSEINGKLSFAVCIMILKELGFTDISFRKEYLKLSILNH